MNTQNFSYSKVTLKLYQRQIDNKTPPLKPIAPFPDLPPHAHYIIKKERMINSYSNLKI